MIGPRIPRSWLEHLNGENLDVVDTDEIESWVSQDHFKTCAFVESVSESHYCQIGMTTIVLGDVNAVYTLECAHRRQLLVARASHERSLLIRGPPSRAHRRLETKISAILSSSAFCNFQTCILLLRPSKCSEPTLCMTSYKCLRMRASQAVHSRGSSEDTSTALEALLDSLSNGEFRSCSSLCWSLL